MNPFSNIYITRHKAKKRKTNSFNQKFQQEVWERKISNLHNLPWGDISSDSNKSNSTFVHTTFWKNFWFTDRGKGAHENRWRAKPELLCVGKMSVCCHVCFWRGFCFKYIHTETTDYEIRNAWITQTTTLLHAALKWEKEMLYKWKRLASAFSLGLY